MRVFQILLLSVFLFGNTSAFAERPSPSCASRFLGTWKHTGGMGQTNMSDVKADGTAPCTGNVGCVTHPTWTCEGNVMIYKTEYGVYKYTLVSPGRLENGANVAVRVGGGGGEAAAPRKQSSQLESGTCPANLSACVTVKDLGRSASAYRYAFALACQKVAVTFDFDDCDGKNSCKVTRGTVSPMMQNSPGYDFRGLPTPRNFKCRPSY